MLSATVLIMAEGGTNKDLSARAIHSFSPRRETPTGTRKLCNDFLQTSSRASR